MGKAQNTSSFLFNTKKKKKKKKKKLAANCKIIILKNRFLFTYTQITNKVCFFGNHVLAFVFFNQ